MSSGRLGDTWQFNEGNNQEYMNKLEGNIALARAIVQRTRGGTHGPLTRLMSPSNFGQILKPFVFLDIFDHEGAPFSAGLHLVPSGLQMKAIVEDIEADVGRD
jgi:hypothetical protein